MKKFFAFILALIALILIPFSVLAVEYCTDEMNYTHKNNLKLRWNIKSGSQYATKVFNMTPSSSNVFGNVAAAVSRLNSQSPANISLTYVGAGQVSNSSNVDVMVAGTDVWNSWQWATGAIATTVPASNGTFYYGYGSLPNSGTVYINYAMVVIAPDQKNMSSNDAVKTIMHELGHVYGMGHSYELNSLMSRYGVKEGKVYTYDYNEFRRMYP